MRRPHALYRSFARWLGRRWDRHASEREALRTTAARSGLPAQVWLHAASAGELEALLPIADALLEEGVRIGLTVFSASGLNPLRSWTAAQPEARRDRIAFAGLSPWEGDWAEALDRWKPRRFVTLKYEAWPELWSELSRRGVPLDVIGARARGSLSFARRMLRLWREPFPAFTFWVFQEEDRADLEAQFPGARFEGVSDPRWDRIAARAARAAERVESVVSAHASRPRPWGVLGSAWLEDLQALAPALERLPGTFWIVPHRLDRPAVARFESFLRAHPKIDARSVLLAEMGLLLELYSRADWAYVGGGFTHGVHNTMEPAYFGIPVAAAPKKAERFAEIPQLMKEGRLRLVRNAQGLERWFERLPSRAERGALTHKCGGAKIIASALARAVHSRS